MIPEVLVSGAGPAGCATAIGLAKRGVSVALVTGPERSPWLEGLSERTRNVLADADCPRAAAAPAEASTRYVSWGSMEGSINREALTQRAVLDRALCADAEAAGVILLRDTLISAQPPLDDTGDPDRKRWRFTLQKRSRPLRAQRWVEARGRRGLGHRASFCGPTTLALAVAFDGAAAPKGASALLAQDHGFVWIAAAAGRGVLQCYADPQDLARSKGGARRHLARCIEDLGQRDGPSWVRECVHTLSPHSSEKRIAARDATARLCGALVGPTWIRVGEAAAATDPLSGQGVFGALASASAAIAVLSTQLERATIAAEPPDEDALPSAERFYRGRIEGRFWREWETGRAFYCDEGRLRDTPFWRRRRALPAAPAAHRGVQRAHSGVRIATQWVVDHGHILERPVLVTSDHPDGVWRVAGVDLVALMRAPRQSRHHLAARFGVEVEAIRSAQRFLAQRDIASCLTEPAPIHQSDLYE